MVYIKDEEFIRGKTPMTKEEVRILSIAKLSINNGASLLDIGAGT
ncbi:MAG: precorrin-6Y C5,15-methyltransferase (decarboxylating) subunit CbiT, partial [Clostridium sp.]|nr:precorrin-6Y C5,15-methyltransferase (decarboxylating) subunit CbiT [Clostridium sp.]